MSPSTPRDIPRLLTDLSGGDRRAADHLAPVLYRELRAIAERLFRAQPAGHTLQPTALVHEVWFRLAGQSSKGPRLRHAGRARHGHGAGTIMVNRYRLVLPGEGPD